MSAPPSESILQFPQRSLFLSKDGFVAAATDAFAELNRRYDELIILNEAPDWARERGDGVFHVALPVPIAETPWGTDAGLNSLMNHMIERNKTIEKMARVEKDGLWFLWVKTK